MRSIRIVPGVLAAALLAGVAGAQQVTKPAVEGVTNFAQLQTTVGCGGAVTTQAVPELKRLGFKSIINVRTAEEKDANVEAEEAAARETGIRYIHLPFSMQSPDPALVDNFLKAISAPANQPAFIHCASGSRAAARWFIKRVELDGWDQVRALDEATELGLTFPGARQFALDYVNAHPRQP